MAVIGGETPLWAQEEENSGIGIALDGLSDYPTHLTVDGFMVALTNLTATEEYQVTVSSDSDNLGIGGCGTATQTETVTGVKDRELRFVVYACAVGEATVTAEVRRTGASSAEASISRRLMVEAIPENAIGARGERVPAAAAGAVPKAGTPGSVPNTYFSHKYLTSVRANWEEPSDGGTDLTGFGLLFWRESDGHPGYANPLVKGKDARDHLFENLQRDTTYRFQIHACNESDSCGYWTVPEVTVKTAGPPKKPHTISVVDKRMRTSARVKWSPEADTGGPDMVLSGFGIRWRERGHSWPTHAQATPGPRARRYTMTGLTKNTIYQVSLQSCNGDNSCSAWTSPLEFRTPGMLPAPPVPTNLAAGTATRTSVPLSWSAVANATKYRVEYRVSGTTAWTTDDETLTTLMHTVDELSCGTAYEFGVSAFGDGTTHLAQWSAPATTSSTTGACVPGQVTGSISADPTTIDPGGFSALSWTTTNATSVSIDQGIGPVRANVAGNRRVEPSSRTTYTLTATGEGGPITRSVTVNVRPEQLTLLGVDSGNGELTLRWEGVGSAANSQATTRSTTRSITGLPLAQVQVQILAPDASWPRDDDYEAGAVRPVTDTAYTFLNLDNGTTYDLRGRRLFDGRIAGAWSVEIQGTAGRSKLASPEVAARPLPDWEIRLEWNSVPNANTYLIKRVIGSQTFAFKSVPSTSPLLLTIQLDHELIEFGSSSITDTITALDSNDNYRPSDPANFTFAENLIARINGAKRNSGGEPVAELKWRRIDGATSYTIHYRKLPGDHRVLGWMPPSPYLREASEGSPWMSVEVTASQQQPLHYTHAIGPLEAKNIYGVYLTFTKGSNHPGISVTEVYVWVSDGSVENGERIATFPLTERLTGSPKTYEYRVCFNLFDETDLPSYQSVTAETIATLKDRWTDMADQALGQWQNATDSLVVMKRNTDDCADYTLAIKAIKEYEEAEGFEHNLFGGPISRDVLIAFLEMIRVYTDIETSYYIYPEIERGYNELNEVIVVNFSNPVINKFIPQAVFSNVTNDIGLADCLFAAGYKPSSGRAIGCVKPRGEFHEEGRPIDIMMSSWQYSIPPSVTAGVRFNSCLDESMDMYENYTILVHEAGHVLGIGGGGEVPADWDERYVKQHSTIGESVMSYKGRNLRTTGDLTLTSIRACAPYPFDVMVVYALYQQ